MRARDTGFHQDHNQFGEAFQIVGEGSEVESIPIRTFRHGGYVDESLISLYKGLNNYFACDARVVADNIISSGQYNLDDRSAASFVGHGVMHSIKNKLIDPKVITGSIGKLAVTRLLSEDLPEPMISRFRSLNQNLLLKKEIEGFEEFYELEAHLRLGSKMANVACMVCVTPFVDWVDVDSSFLNFRARAMKVGSSGGRKAWEAIKEESKVREGAAIERPFRGGLVNPN